MTLQEKRVFEEVLDIVDDWQKSGRNGHCLPVLRGKLLEELEELADDRRRENCSICYGLGYLKEWEDSFACGACKRLAGGGDE